MRTSAALLGLLLCAAGMARAESVPFTTLARGQIGAPGAPANHVIRSEQDLRAAGVDRLLPAGTSIDWNTEMVIACLMGTRSNGGYSIEVTGLDRSLWVPPVPPGSTAPAHAVLRLDVQVAQRTPAPGSIVTMVITSPYHVIKTARTGAGTVVAFSDASATAPSFTHVRYEVVRPMIGASTTTFRLQADGRCSLERRVPNPNAFFHPVDGVATPAELRAVDAAIRAARIESIPDQLPTPIHIVPGDTFTLRVDSPQAALTGTVQGEVGYFVQYDARLRPLVDALKAIETRITTAPPPPAPDDEAKGTVRVTSAGVFLEESSHTSYRLSGPIAATARKFEGRLIKVAGRLLDPLPTTATPGTVIRFETTRLLHPTELTDGSIQVQPTGGAPNIHVQGQRVRETFGPAARVIRRLGQGRSLQVDGYVFCDLQDRPERLYAERVAGKAKVGTILRRNGQYAGYVRKDQAIEVLELNAAGTQARVNAGARTGWMAVSRLEVGQVPVPLHGPVNGLTSSIPGQ